MTIPEFDFEAARADDPDAFQKKAKYLVAENFNTIFFGALNDKDKALPEHFYVVWFAKVLGNWKALVSTDLIKGSYWEVTYNGNKLETYIDHYVKHDNAVLSDNWYNNASMS